MYEFVIKLVVMIKLIEKFGLLAIISAFDGGKGYLCLGSRQTPYS